MFPDKKDEDPPWFTPFLDDVIIAPDIFTKLHPTMLSKLRKALVDNRSHTRPRGKKNWEEIVKLDGVRYAVVCRPNDDGKIVMKKARPAQIPR